MCKSFRPSLQIAGYLLYERGDLTVSYGKFVATDQDMSGSFLQKKGVRIRGHFINHYSALAYFGIKSANQVASPISSSTSSTFKPFIIARLLSPSSVASCIEIPPAAAIPV